MKPYSGQLKFTVFQEESNNPTETAKALEWLIANMSRAAQEVQKRQHVESSGHTVRLEPSIDEAADTVQTNSVDEQRLHSGEVVFRRLDGEVRCHISILRTTNLLAICISFPFREGLHRCPCIQTSSALHGLVRQDSLRPRYTNTRR